MTATADLAAYWSAVDEGDERRALAVALQAFESGIPIEQVLQDLVVAAQVQVGELWATNAWTVAREHAATAVGETVVRELTTHIPAPPVDGSRLVVACVEREWHAMPALVLAQTLRAWGHDVDYLGASASRDHLVGRVVDAGPRAVLLSASLSSSLPRVRRLVEAVRGTGTPVVVGGRAFDPDGRRARSLGATAYAADPAALADVLETLPRHVGPATPLRHPGALESRQLQVTAEQITAAVTDVLRERLGLADEPRPDEWTGVLSGHVGHIVDCLAGALLTEDPGVLGENRRWLAEVLAGRGAAPETVDLLWEVLAAELREFPEATALLEVTR